MVRIVTDSTSDLPPEVARDLGITVVPVILHFGTQSYRDGVDMAPEKLYERMVSGPVHPTTSSPAPGEFAEVYRRLSRETDEILCLTISSKLSGIHQAATTGKQAFGGKTRIEVVDTQLTTMCLGLLATLAAREARDGKSLDDLLAIVRSAIPRSHGMALLDSARYVLKGGRLGKSGALLGALVRVKPMLEIKDGWVRPSGVTRTRSQGLERLCQYVTKHLPVEAIAVVQGNAAEEAEELAGRIRGLSPHTPPIMAKLGSAIGVHGGPGTLLVALRESGGEAGRARARKFTLPTLRIPRRQQ